MAVLWIEANCFEHGFERYKIRIVKKFNIPSEQIIPKFRSRPKPGELSCLLIGRDVDFQEVEKYMVNYLRQKGLLEFVIRMHIEF